MSYALDCVWKLIPERVDHVMFLHTCIALDIGAMVHLYLLPHKGYEYFNDDISYMLKGECGKNFCMLMQGTWVYYEAAGAPLWLKDQDWLFTNPDTYEM